MIIQSRHGMSLLRSGVIKQHKKTQNFQTFLLHLNFSMVGIVPCSGHHLPHPTDRWCHPRNPLASLDPL